MAGEAKNSCAHEACGCISQEGAMYCSPYCANVDVHESDAAACACGHEACGAAQRVPHVGDETITSIGGGPGREGGSG